jgi:hypothetical protein
MIVSIGIIRSFILCKEGFKYGFSYPNDGGVIEVLSMPDMIEGWSNASINDSQATCHLNH